MRREFAKQLVRIMKVNPDVVLITADLGWKMLDEIRDTCPKQFFNVGASEQLMLGMAVGMAYEGKTVFCYSITPFLLSRGHEWIRNYINHEQLNIKLIGSGRDYDYEHDGMSHWAHDDVDIMIAFNNIIRCYPEHSDSASIKELISTAILNKKPYYINLKR